MRIKYRFYNTKRNEVVPLNTVFEDEDDKTLLLADRRLLNMAGALYSDLDNACRKIHPNLTTNDILAHIELEPQAKDVMCKEDNNGR